MLRVVKLKRNRIRGFKLNTIVLESTEHGDFPIDVYHKLANDRILFVTEQIDDRVAADVTATLLLKDIEDNENKITLFLNSHGGDIRNVLMICDTINLIEAPVETVCIGAAMDEAALILASGSPGMRFATKNSVIAAGQLVHDWITRANLTDARKYLELATADNKRMMEIFAKTTGKTLKEIMTQLERRVFMSAPQALKFGLIDKIVTFNK